ncbi:hypothetical protein B0H14DRAFT_2562034 [Mycena olivaceomarginata]|nr:hypothetical protein B0H14DRAFT_2562034 [Mycena olivaceomarginata]
MADGGRSGGERDCSEGDGRDGEWQARAGMEARRTGGDGVQRVGRAVGVARQYDVGTREGGAKRAQTNTSRGGGGEDETYRGAQGGGAMSEGIGGSVSRCGKRGWLWTGRLETVACGMWCVACAELNRMAECPLVAILAKDTTGAAGCRSRVGGVHARSATELSANAVRGCDLVGPRGGGRVASTFHRNLGGNCENRVERERSARL